MKKLKYLIMMLTAIAVASCSEEELLNEPSFGNGELENLTIGEENTVDSLNSFAIDFLSKASTAGESNAMDENMAVSPYGAITNLAILANSCDDNITNSILDIMGVEDLKVLNSTMQKLEKSVSFKSGNEVTSISESIWYDNRINVSDDWKAGISSVFNPFIKMVDFSNPATLGEMNSWCSKNTDGMIPNMFDRIDDSTSLIIMNALFFSAEWNHRFNVENTREQEFNGTQRVSKVPMMHMNSYFNCRLNEDFTSITIAFSGPTNMILVLPNEGLDIREFASTLSYEKLKNKAELELCHVKLDLPRFEIRTSADLTGVLTALGLPKHFVLEKMGDMQKKEMKMRQSFVLNVDEDGAKAASVTVSEVSDMAPSKVKEIDLSFNRPFIFLLENSTSGIITMAGIVSNL